MCTEEAGENRVGPERGTAQWGAATVHAGSGVGTCLQKKLQHVGRLGLHCQVQGAPAARGLLEGAAERSEETRPTLGITPPCHTVSLGQLTGLLRSAPAFRSSRTISASLWMTATCSGVWPGEQ